MTDKPELINWLKDRLGGYLEELESIEAELEKLRQQRMEQSDQDTDDIKRLRRLAIAELEHRKTTAESSLGHALWNLYQYNLGVYAAQQKASKND